MPSKQRATGDHEPPRYEIHVRGPLGPTIMEAFPTLVARRRGQDTVLGGSLPDQCALYGVIHQLESLGLQLLEIRRVPGPSGPPTESLPGWRDSPKEPPCRDQPDP